METTQRMDDFNVRLAAIEEVVIALVTLSQRQQELRALTTAVRGEAVGRIPPQALEVLRRQIDMLLGLAPRITGP